jgi:hypothetical protein
MSFKNLVKRVLSGVDFFVHSQMYKKYPPLRTHFTKNLKLIFEAAVWETPLLRLPFEGILDMHFGSILKPSQYIARCAKLCQMVRSSSQDMSRVGSVSLYLPPDPPPSPRNNDERTKAPPRVTKRIYRKVTGCDI